MLFNIITNGFCKNVEKEQLRSFCDVVEHIEKTNEVSQRPTLQASLSRAYKIIKDLHGLVTTKLIDSRDGTTRARRRAWLRNKRKIVRLQDKLKDVREALLGAVCTDLLSIYFIFRELGALLTRYLRLSTHRIESTLSTLNQEVTTIHARNSSICHLVKAPDGHQNKWNNSTDSATSVIPNLAESQIKLPVGLGNSLDSHRPASDRLSLVLGHQ